MSFNQGVYAPQGNSGGPPPPYCIFQTSNYATLQALAAANGLVACQEYKISDRGDLGIVVKAATNSQFRKEAIYIASSTDLGVTYEYCEYDFNADLVYHRLDGANRGNDVEDSFNGAILYFPWGYNAIINNRCFYAPINIDGGVDKATLNIQSNDLAIAGGTNIHEDGVFFHNNHVNEGSGIHLYENAHFHDNVCSTAGVINANANTIIASCFFDNTLGLDFIAGIYINECEFYFTPFSFDVNYDFSNCYYNGNIKLSTFDVAIDADVNANLELAADSICGIIIPTADGDVIEQICTSDGNYSLMHHDITIAPQALNELEINPTVTLSFYDIGAPPVSVADTLTFDNASTMEVISISNIITITYSSLAGGTLNPGDSITGTGTGFTGSIQTVNGADITVLVISGDPFDAFGETEINDTTTGATADVDRINYSLTGKVTSGDVSGTITFTDDMTTATAKVNTITAYTITTGQIITGASSGATAKISGYSGNGYDVQTAYLINMTGTFTANENITTPSGGSAYAGAFATSDVTITINDKSIAALSGNPNIILPDGIKSTTVSSALQQFITFSYNPATNECVYKTCNYCICETGGSIKISLTALDIQSLGSTPIQAVAAPGAGKAIQVISASANLIFNTTAFTNSSLNYIINTAPKGQALASGLFNSVSNNFKTAELTSEDANIIENEALMLATSADSAVGDGTCDIYIKYQIITL